MDCTDDVAEPIRVRFPPGVEFRRRRVAGRRTFSNRSWETGPTSRWSAYVFGPEWGNGADKPRVCVRFPTGVGFRCRDVAALYVSQPELGNGADKPPVCVRFSTGAGKRRLQAPGLRTFLDRSWEATSAVVPDTPDSEPPEKGPRPKDHDHSNVRISRRVATNRQSIDIAAPQARVATSTLLAPATTPNRGVIIGVIARSPSRFSDDTRPR